MSPRMKTSVLWQYFTDTGNRRARCHICLKQISFSSTSANLKNHLKRTHKTDYKQFQIMNGNKEMNVNQFSPKSKQRRSHLWDYFTIIDRPAKIAACDICLNKLSFKTTTTNLTSHLKKKHPNQYIVYKNSHEKDYETANDAAEIEDTEAISNIPSMDNGEDESFLIFVDQTATQDDHEAINPHYQQNEDSLITIKSEPGHHRHPHDQTVSPRVSSKTKITSTTSTTIDKRETDTILLKFIIGTLQSLSIVENENFKSFVTSLNPNYEIPTSKDISEKIIPNLYEKSMSNVKLILEGASVVSLSVDYWTTVKEEEYISLTVHFITNDFEYKSFLVKCCQIRKNDSESLSMAIEQTLNVWDLDDKVTSCVTNNPKISAAVQDSNITHYESISDKLNCCALAAMEIMEQTLINVRKIVSYYNHSERAKEMLKQYQIDQNSKLNLTLIGPESTRWDSNFLMIERFIKLEDAVRATMPGSYSNIPTLSDKEWTQLKQLTLILKPFVIATKELSAENFVSASKAVAVITGLKSVIEDISSDLSNTFEDIKDIVEVLHSMVKTNFSTIECEGDLPLCSALDPRFKLDIFSDEATIEKIKRDLIKNVEVLIQKNSEAQEVTRSENEESDDESNKFNIWRHLSKAKRRRTLVKMDSRYHAAQEVENYLNDVSDSKCDPYSWWRRNNYKYPHLATLFKITCHLPASCVPYNSTNSIVEYRRFISNKQAEQLMFLNANLDQVNFDCNPNFLVL